MQAIRGPAWPAWPGVVAVVIASCSTIDPGLRSVKPKGTVVCEVPWPATSVWMSSQISLRGLAYCGLVDGAWGVAAGSM
jgi:hypothetical protein